MMMDTEPRTATYQKLTAGVKNNELSALHIELSAGSMIKNQNGECQKTSM